MMRRGELGFAEMASWTWSRMPETSSCVGTTDVVRFVDPAVFLIDSVPWSLSQRCGETGGKSRTGDGDGDSGSVSVSGSSWPRERKDPIQRHPMHLGSTVAPSVC